MGLTNNDIFKKLRVAHKLRDNDIVDICALVDFKVSKSELGAIFRNENHPKYVERNRKQQQRRNLKRKQRLKERSDEKLHIAKMNELEGQTKILSGYYRLTSMEDTGIAKMNELIVKIEIISGSNH